jgi:hypothetical protein
MAQLVEATAVDGFTNTVFQLTAAGSDTVVATATVTSPETNRKAVYVGSFTGVPIGVYRLMHFMSEADDGHPLDASWVEIKAADGVFQAYHINETSAAEAVWLNTTRGLTEDVTTDTESRNASKADVSALALQATLSEVLTDTGTTLPSTLATIVSYIDTEVAAIKAKTDNLPADPATETTLATLDGLIDAIKAVTDTLSLSAISTNVRTEIDTNSTKLISILEDTGTTLPAAIDAIESGSGLDAAGVRAAIGLASANLDTQLSAIDTVVDNILVDTGTTLPSTLATIDGIADQILADTNELQLNQGNWLTADISGLATQASINAIDTVVDAILVDTNELQTNQGDWVTADLSSLVTLINNVPTVAEFEARTLPSGSYFDPTTDTVARVTLVDTVTVNTDMISVTGITTELAKVPKVGQTHRYSQVAVDAENKTADVTISATS